MLVKTLIVIIMIAIAFNLFRGLFFLVKDQGKSKRTARSLSWRVGFSFALFLLLLLAIHQGWIEPHGLPQIPPQP